MIEGLFGHLKPAIRDTYRKVSHHLLQVYVNEFVWRRNARYSPTSMFEQLVLRCADF
jgi:hypothetical protein